jgi:hypothetical protein
MKEAMKEVCIACPMSLLCRTLEVWRILYCRNNRRAGTLNTRHHNLGMYGEDVTETRPFVPVGCPCAMACAGGKVDRSGVPCDRMETCSFGKPNHRNVEVVDERVQRKTRGR